MDKAAIPGPLQTERLLVVEDSDAGREVLGIKLRREGYSVAEATNGKEALEQAASGNIDLVLLDLKLPDMSGLKVLRQLRRLRSMLDMPVIVVSALDHPSDVVQALQSGANDYVTKPFDLTVALARIRTQLSVRQLKQANDRFLRVASHDLKKPLLLMLDVARLFKEDQKPGAPLSADACSSLDYLIESGEYMQHIVEDLLGLSALQQGRLHLAMLPADLGGIVRQAIARNSVYAQRKDISLAMHCEKDLPNIMADEFRLMQVLENLIGNALKFGPPASHVQIAVRSDAEGVLCEVADTGPGIPPQDIDKLFAEFSTLSNQPTGNEKSTGLGLSICRELIYLHGGQIGVHNNSGPGCTFWFRLPPEKRSHL
ncbi:MAG: hybrid sensor histidine kinase/response regulator [Acidiferrobacterales bacterium]